MGMSACPRLNWRMSSQMVTLGLSARLCASLVGFPHNLHNAEAEWPIFIILCNSLPVHGNKHDKSLGPLYIQSPLVCL